MRLLIVGAGGHAKVVLDAALRAGMDVAALRGEPGDATAVLGVPVIFGEETAEADSFIVGVGDNETRATLFAAWQGRGLRPASVVHPSAVIADSARIGAGTFIAAGVVVNPDARIGGNAILNTGCTVDHDCVIGDHAHIAPGVSLSGAVFVGDGTLLGVGSCALPGVRVGAWSVVGAGAAVVHDIAGATVAAGVPASVVRTVERAE